MVTIKWFPQSSKTIDDDWHWKYARGVGFFLVHFKSWPSSFFYCFHSRQQSIQLMLLESVMNVDEWILFIESLRICRQNLYFKNSRAIFGSCESNLKLENRSDKFRKKNFLVRYEADESNLIEWFIDKHDINEDAYKILSIVETFHLSLTTAWFILWAWVILWCQWKWLKESWDAFKSSKRLRMIPKHFYTLMIKTKWNDSIQHLIAFLTYFPSFMSHIRIPVEKLVSIYYC